MDYIAPVTREFQESKIDEPILGTVLVMPDGRIQPLTFVERLMVALGLTNAKSLEARYSRPRARLTLARRRLCRPAGSAMLAGRCPEETSLLHRAGGAGRASGAGRGGQQLRHHPCPDRSCCTPAG